jgi:hypothetical protein
MSGTVLAIEATDQPEFAGAWQYRNGVITLLNQQGYGVTVEDGTNAVSEVVSPIAADPTQNITFISGVGHGTANSFLGFARQPVFQINQYDPEVVENKIIHLTSCDTGDSLGPDFVQNGCIAFFGYSSLVSWNDDTTAAGWFECDAAIDVVLANGGSAQDAHGAAVKAFSDKINALRNANNGAGADCLEAILSCLCSPVIDPKYGRTDATLT